MKTILKFILNIVVYVAIVGVTVFGLPRFLAWKLNTTYPMAAITSGSMWPALKEGDLVFIEGVPKETLETGDIIVYRNPTGNGFTIHRIKELRDDELVTKGDANFKDDEPVPYDHVVGRTYQMMGTNARIPYLGFITVYAAKN